MLDTFYLPTEKILVDFKKYLTDKGFSKPSVSYYLSDARVFLAAFKDQSPMVFTETAIKEYLLQLKAKSVNPTTIKRKTTALKHLQLFLIENGFLIESTIKRAGTGIVNPQILTVSLTSAIAGAALTALCFVILTKQTPIITTGAFSGNFKPIEGMTVRMANSTEGNPILVSDQSPFQVNIDTEDQSSGRATIAPNKTFVDVYGNISKDDLVFLSPVLIATGINYSVPQVTDGYFRIELSGLSTKETVINWHIVKQLPNAR